MCLQQKNLLSTVSYSTYNYSLVDIRTRVYLLLHTYILKSTQFMPLTLFQFRSRTTIPSFVHHISYLRLGLHAPCRYFDSGSASTCALCRALLAGYLTCQVKTQGNNTRVPLYFMYLLYYLMGWWDTTRHTFTFKQQNFGMWTVVFMGASRGVCLTIAVWYPETYIVMV